MSVCTEYGVADTLLVCFFSLKGLNVYILTTWTPVYELTMILLLWTALLIIWMLGPTEAAFGDGTEDGWWDGFTNKFTTDLAHVISLFGEQVTKQFLSEIVSFMDLLSLASHLLVSSPLLRCDTRLWRFLSYVPHRKVQRAV